MDNLVTEILADMKKANNRLKGIIITLIIVLIFSNAVWLLTR